MMLVRTTKCRNHWIWCWRKTWMNHIITRCHRHWHLLRRHGCFHFFLFFYRFWFWLLFFHFMLLWFLREFYCCMIIEILFQYWHLYYRLHWHLRHFWHFRLYHFRGFFIVFFNYRHRFW